MTKKCPKCGKIIPDESKFCLECGCHIHNGGNGKSNNVLANGKIFLVLIFIALIVGGILIFSMGNGDNNAKVEDTAHPDAKEFDFTIADIDGYYASEGVDKPYYFFWVEILFQKVPSNQKDYTVRITYLDENNTNLGQEIDGLSSIYYDADYPISAGYHTSYKYIDVDSVKVEIIKEGNVVKEATAKIDKNKLNYDKPDTNKTR